MYLLDLVYERKSDEAEKPVSAVEISIEEEMTGILSDPYHR